METKHFVELQDKGYTIIRNYISYQEVLEWKKLWKEVEIQAMLEDRGIKKFDEKGSASIYVEDGKPYVFKTQNVIRRTTKGKEYIQKFENELMNIHPNIRFIKDRFMNQKTNYQGHLPHQDVPANIHRHITNEWYTVYISLTDTNEENGGLWVEDISPKRTTALEYCADGCANGKKCLCQNGKIMPFDIKSYKGHNMIPVDLKIGDVIIFDGWVLHGTAANLSNETRQTLMLTYGKLKDKDLEVENIFDYYQEKHPAQYN
jgi:hypothetical protein